MKKYNIIHPNTIKKNYCFTNIDNEMNENHFLALKYINLFKPNGKIKGFEKLLMTIVH
jgi:hypothetical protein